KTQRPRGLADVAAESIHRLSHEQALDLLETEILEADGLAGASQVQVDRPDAFPRGHQDGSLDRVVELADVARPGMGDQRLEGGRVELGQRLAVPPGMYLQEVARQRRYVLAPL